LKGSLVEMVLAITLSGLLLAGAIAPVMSVMVAYQRTQPAANNGLLSDTAALRAATVAGSVWRDANAPAGLGNITVIGGSALTVGNWALTVNGGRLQQAWQGGTAAPLTTPIDQVSFQYQLDDGAWTSSVADTARVRALRLSWRDPNSLTTLRTTALTLDRALDAGALVVDQPTSGGTYNRSTYTRNVALTIGNWP
jgi:hypothetical protein